MIRDNSPLCLFAAFFLESLHSEVSHLYTSRGIPVVLAVLSNKHSLDGYHQMRWSLDLHTLHGCSQESIYQTWVDGDNRLSVSGSHFTFLVHFLLNRRKKICKMFGAL